MIRRLLSAALGLCFPAALWAQETGDFRPLFNGKDLSGWRLIDPKADNGWSVAAHFIRAYIREKLSAAAARSARP